MAEYKGSGSSGSEKAGIQSGTTFIEKCGPQGKAMDSSKKSQKPLANPSESAPRGHTIK